MGNWDRKEWTDNKVYIFKPAIGYVNKNSKTWGDNTGKYCRTQVLELFTQEVRELGYLYNNHWLRANLRTSLNATS